MGNDDPTLPPNHSIVISGVTQNSEAKASSREVDSGASESGGIDSSTIGAKSNKRGLELGMISGFELSTSEFGDYEIIEEVARGGMGVVFKARQKKLDRICAIKMILSGQLADEGEIERFYAEAQAAANLYHQGIVSVYEVGDVNGQHFFSMEYVEGRSLQDELDEGRIDVMRATRLVKEVAEAVAYAHEKSIIHRDLKPANVLVGDDGRARVTDFGLARRMASTNSVSDQGKAVGTPSYMSPEQAVGNSKLVDERSDIYSIGAVLYAVITGTPPFKSSSPIDTMIQVIEREPVEPSRLNREIGKDLEAITLKCLEKESGRRYKSANDLAMDLQRCLDGEPVLARKVNEHDRWVKWAIRKPLLATAILTLVMIGSLVVATIALKPSMITEAVQAWTRSLAAQVTLFGMLIAVVSFALYQAFKTLSDGSGKWFGFVRVITVLPVGFIGVAVAVAVIRLTLLLFSPDYDIFHGPDFLRPDEQSLSQSLKIGVDRLRESK